MAVLTLASARAAGLRKDEVYRMARSGELERIGRGVYARAGELDPAVAPLSGATALKPSATMCLTSALVHHGLSDEIPHATDIALPRGTRFPAGFDHVTWHAFAPETFEVGRVTMPEHPDLTMYSAERSVVDAFRTAHLEGIDQANEALRRWVRRPGSSPAELLRTAGRFPRTVTAIRHALQVLL
ncbi:type IV toxin-antitoxin system AbiEi family antitoxin domain-containing protein [Cellulomonas sp. PhB143]|uniref:type IV toxin-antitoxin system AbiEi family antitoxin domain-containing protein n=1 Tax=Cellulomonas sp. PhB143 TaxID=2485186 RepID=UPI000F4775E5|nr:type IV toxin-antitoxin system AbiEi family antitoxin domain-containing protein [Cellulomonas sp. PhB143]ROS73614.1 putative AbiEi antitoxin of type IV toxin-antitoxin system [Cellulomonas sp. PhB143]